MADAITLVDGDVYFTSAPISAITTTQINSGDYITARVTIGHPGGTFEMMVDNQPVVIPIPKPRQQSPSQYDTITNPSLATINTANIVYIIDLFRINTNFTAIGILSNEQGGDSVATKRDNLERLSKYGGVVRMVYRTESNQKVVTGIIKKLSIREQSTGRETDEDSIGTGSPISYAVNVQFIRGENR